MTTAFPQQLTPELLTATLQRSAHLTSGSVSGVTIVRSFETPPSILAQLRLTFAPGTETSAPAELLFKMPKAHKLARGRREARFYRELAPLMPALPLVPCYAADELPEVDAPFILLADLTATHQEIPRAALTWQQLGAMVDLLAQLHAHWWEHPDLGWAAVQSPEERLTDEFAGITAGYREFIELHGHRLAPAERCVFDAYVQEGPALLLDRARRGPLTLCHPDSHQGNFLFPRHDNGPIYLIDWHGYQSWWGPADLAVLILRCLSVEQIQRRDELVHRYYQQLLRRGLTRYRWEQCREDYRLGIIDFLGSAIGYRRWQPWIDRHLPPLLHELGALACGDLL